MIAARNLDICRLMIDKGAQVEAKKVVAELRFIRLLHTTALRLFVSFVIMERMLRHGVIMDGGHYIWQSIMATSLS